MIAVVVVVLPDPLREIGARRNFEETQQSGHALQGLEQRSKTRLRLLQIVTFVDNNNQMLKVQAKKV